MFEFTENPQEGKCKVKYCGKEPKRIKGGLCEKHSKQLWRHNNPKKYAYNNLKDSARQRKLEFKMSFDYFRGLADSLGYFDKVCQERGEIATIDRVDATKGYVEGNLQVISLSENVIKGNKERYLPEYVQALMERKRLEEIEQDVDCPF